MTAVKLVGPTVDGVDTISSLTDRLGALHRRYGQLLRGVSFALDQLDRADSTSGEDTLTHLRRAQAVLTDVMTEISR